MDNGYGAPFVTLMDEGGGYLNVKVTHFKYVYSVEQTDTSTIVVESDDPTIIDSPAIQPHSPIRVKWGYIGESSVERILYVIDSAEEYGPNGITITLSCYPKAYYLRFMSTPGMSGDETYEEFIEKVCDKNNIKWVNPMVAIQYTPEYNPNQFQTTGGSIAGTATESDINALRLARQNVVGQYISSILNYHFMRRAALSDWEVFQELLQEGTTDGVPELILRDDTLQLQLRDFSKPASLRWDYARGSGNIIRFHTQSNNRENLQEATHLEAGGWEMEEKSWDQAAIGPNSTSQPQLADIKPGDSLDPTPNTLKAFDPTNAKIQESSITSWDHPGDGLDPELINEFLRYGMNAFEVRFPEENIEESFQPSPNQLTTLGGQTGYEEVTGVSYPTWDELADPTKFTRVDIPDEDAMISGEVPLYNIYIPVVKATVSRSDSDRSKDLEYVSIDENGNEVYGTITVPTTPNISLTDNTQVVGKNPRLQMYMNISREVIITNADPEDEEADIVRKGLGQQQEASSAMFTAQASILGDVRVEASQVVTVTGLGVKNSGNWYVTRSEHEISNNGYIVHTEVTRDSTNVYDEAMPSKQGDTNSAESDGTDDNMSIPMEDGDTKSYRSLFDYERDALGYMYNLATDFAPHLFPGYKRSIMQRLDDISAQATPINMIFNSWQLMRRENTFIDEAANPGTQKRALVCLLIKRDIDDGVIYPTDEIVRKLNPTLKFIREYYQPMVADVKLLEGELKRKQDESD